MQTGESPTHLSGMGLVCKPHDAQTRGTDKDLTIGSLNKAGGIATALLSFDISHRDIIECTTVPCLQGAIHTEIEQAVAVLYNRIHVIAGKRPVGFVLTAEHPELIAIVTVDTVASGSP